MVSDAEPAGGAEHGEEGGSVSYYVRVTTNGDTLMRGDLFYENRKLYRVERVGKPRGKKKTYSVKFRLIGKVNLNLDRVGIDV